MKTAGKRSATKMRRAVLANAICVLTGVAFCSYFKVLVPVPTTFARARRVLGYENWLQYDYDNLAAQRYWLREMSQGEINSADFARVMTLTSLFKHHELNKKDEVILVGGTNAGQLSDAILHNCPQVTFHGFEVQKEFYTQVRNRLSAYPNVHIHNLGWSDQAGTARIGGEGGTAGLYDPNGQRGWKMQHETVTTTTLSNFTSEKSIEKVLYLVIDTEGHEPKVIRGMELEHAHNRERFSLFQFELGGTWAEQDARHGGDAWTQYTTAAYLHNLGYDLFLIGFSEWLHVQPTFFMTEDNPSVLDEGFGPFVQGNLLAMYKTVHQGLRRSILRNTYFPKRD